MTLGPIKVRILNTFYKTVKKLGPNHNPFFEVNVQIQNSKKFHGEGNSKKIAQQNAALKLIRNLNI